MPYIERAEDGRIVCLYGALAPEFQQARNYLSTGKLQARLEEYPAVHEVAARLGLSFDDAVTDICARWPEWMDSAESEGATPADQEQGADQENGKGEEANSGEGIQELVHDEVLTAYEDSFNEIAMDLSEDDLGLGGDPVPDFVDPGVDGQDAVGDDLEAQTDSDAADDVAAGDAVDDIEIVAGSGGVLIRELGDALTTAKAVALMAVDDERFQRVGDYDKAANQARLDELRAIQQAIREGVHPAFTDEQTEELQALETFLPFIQRIDDYAQGLRDAIREAGDLEVLTSIDLISGWPE